jgi:hypothetical protein
MGFANRLRKDVLRQSFLACLVPGFFRHVRLLPATLALDLFCLHPGVMSTHLNG